jgi:hypothetical protein
MSWLWLQRGLGQSRLSQYLGGNLTAVTLIVWQQMMQLAVRTLEMYQLDVLDCSDDEDTTNRSKDQPSLLALQ